MKKYDKMMGREPKTVRTIIKIGDDIYLDAYTHICLYNHKQKRGGKGV